MKIHVLYALPLAASLLAPAVGQQTPTDAQQPSASSQTANQPATTSSPDTSQAANMSSSNSDPSLSAHQPLPTETHEGFWGRMNPMARKKYVQRQLEPMRNRVNELDELTASNSKAIKDVDARAQEGIRQASAKANEADQHAVDAGNRAQQANQLAQQASTRVGTVEQVVGNIDQYQTTNQTEIRFRNGQSALNAKAKEALDQMVSGLNGQKGYVIEVQGFSATRGQAGIQSSQAMADAVVRYLVEQHEIPVYRISVLGMGNATMQTANTANNMSSSNPAGTNLPDNAGPSEKPHGNRVEVSLLKNNLDQLASNGSPQSSTTSQPTQPQ